MSKYRKKPVVIEAFQLTKETRWSNENWPDWMHLAWNDDHDVLGSLSPAGLVADSKVSNDPVSSDELTIKTLEGTMLVSLGDWIIRGIQGELYPCKPDIFAKTYEAVDG